MPAIASPAAARRRSDFVILSLNHADIVEQAVFGPDGVAEAATASKAPDRHVFDRSRRDRRMAHSLRHQTGMTWVDCPLSGGVPGALAENSPSWRAAATGDFERARAVMQDLAANYTLMGGSGAGQTTKLVNQLFCALAFQAVAEAVKLAEAGGVDPAKIPAGAGRWPRRQPHHAGVHGEVRARDFTPTGRIDNMLKDLDSVQAFALKTRTPLPLTGAVTEIHRLLIAMGLGAKDSAEAMRLLDGK